jgi:hypothetical protein
MAKHKPHPLILGYRFAASVGAKFSGTQWARNSPMQKYKANIALITFAAITSLLTQTMAAQRSTGPGSTQGSGQSSGTPSISIPQQATLPSVGPNEIPGMTDSDIANRQERLRNTDRQKQLVLDTERLLALANELKVDVDKSTKNTLSLDVIRKADEIEKLAHAVKEKMKGE